MLRSPSLAAHQIVITSCKAICLETLCWWPPVFKRGPWPEVCWWLFQTSLIGWQAEWSKALGPGPIALLDPDPDLRQGPTFQFPAFMFVLLHLDSCKSLPSDVQVKGKGNGNPSWGWGYNLLTFSSVGGKMDHSVSPLFELVADFLSQRTLAATVELEGENLCCLSACVFICTCFWYTRRLDHVKQGHNIL